MTEPGRDEDELYRPAPAKSSRRARTSTSTSTDHSHSHSLHQRPSSFLHPHSLSSPPYEPCDSALHLAGSEKTASPRPFRALQRRLTSLSDHLQNRPSNHLLWKSSSAVPTLSTIPAVSASSTPLVDPAPTIRMAHEGLNPHTASDLLRQAMMQNRVAGEEDHDQIGSNSSTPPGAATPRPDPTDKRLPGILHSYFGQVRDSFRMTSKPEECPVPAPPTTHEAHPQSGHDGFAQNNGGRMPGNALPTAPCSPSEVQDGDAKTSPSSPHEPPPAPPPQAAMLNPLPLFLPTPPTSSSSSLHQVSKEELGTQGSRPSSSRALSARDRKDTPEEWPSKSRRHTFVTSSPLCSIVTETVASAHISNPATRAPTSPSSPSVPFHLASRRSSGSKSQDDGKKLTDGGKSPPRLQNTPPQTPRTQSHEGKPAPTPSRLGRSAASQSAAAVRPPKGKLSVSITEGRGLRPSIDPYVVCQFQWAEYISDGPRGEAAGNSGGEGQAPGPAAIPMRRQDSDMGRPMAIPMKSRQSSNTGVSSDPRENGKYTTHPRWDHEAIFDVVGDRSEIDVSVYDKSNGEAFLGHVRLCPNLVEYERAMDKWFRLESRDGEADEVSGEIRLRIRFHTAEKKHYGPEDFSILKLIGKGTFGQVFQVRKKDTRRIYAMKVLSKKVIVQKKEVAHTLGERNILVRTAMSDSPFIVGLKFSFQTPADLYLVTDYMSGGELFWHLQKEGRFLEARAKFYIAELILALQHLHNHDIVYRDLKPENILLDAKGHIALCDFGLSKANITEDATTNTFCGTTEYLAPEVLLDEHGYTKMVDFWSLGVLVFEMCCGWSPFYAEDTQQMYKNIAFGKVRFPRDALSTEGRNFVKGLLNRNPKHRLGATRDAEELKAHAFFADIDWVALAKKNVAPPFKPKLKSEEDVSNFDPEFTNALNGGVGSLNARAAALASGAHPASTPLSPTMQANFKGFTFVDESAMDKQFRDRDDLDRMDEDMKDDDWEKPFSKRGDRMSGIITNDNDDSIFGNGRFDDV